MKKIAVLLLLLASLAVKAQNEFDAAAFYSDFKKICADAQKGFSSLKGRSRNSEYPELQSEYNIKLLLPGSDSGKIVFPVNGNPHAVFYFSPHKNRTKTDQEGVNLREAVEKAYNEPLYIRTETTTVKGHPFTNTWFFKDAGETSSPKALFRMNIYYQEGKYYLQFEIRGQPASP